MANIFNHFWDKEVYLIIHDIRHIVMALTQ
jgi:hypothetical protein